MITRSSAVVAPGGRLRSLSSAPPLTLRRVFADDQGTCALCLVGSAAGPLPGDDLTLCLDVEPAARAVLTATGASIAQGRSGDPATVRLEARVGAGARLVADPGPLVACEGSRVDVAVAIDAAADAHVEWQELVVLGRSTDATPGAATLRWDVVRDGRPVLRQAVDLTGPGRRSLTAGHRVLATTLISGPDVDARTVVHSPTAVAARIDAGTMLLTVLGDSAAEVTRALRALRDLPAPV